MLFCHLQFTRLQTIFYPNQLSTQKKPIVTKTQTPDTFYGVVRFCFCNPLSKNLYWHRSSIALSFRAISEHTHKSYRALNTQATYMYACIHTHTHTSAILRLCIRDYMIIEGLKWEQNHHCSIMVTKIIELSN